MNNKSYFINRGAGGNCVKFIASLIIYNTKRDRQEMLFWRGNSHDYLKKNIQENVVITDIQNIENVETFLQLEHTNTNFLIVHVYYSDSYSCKVSELFHFLKLLRYTDKDLIKRSFNYLGRPCNKYLDDLSNLPDQDIKKIYDDVYLKSVCHRVPFVPQIPDKFQDKVWLINFNDILYNQEKILLNLERFTGFPILEELKINYDRYLKIQFDLINRFL